MHVTGQERDTNSSAQGVFLKSLNEPIALSLERGCELKVGVQCENMHHVVFGRPMVIL
jgi:hypothetical protein